MARFSSVVDGTGERGFFDGEGPFVDEASQKRGLVRLERGGGEEGRLFSLDRGRREEKVAIEDGSADEEEVERGFAKEEIERPEDRPNIVA